MIGLTAAMAFAQEDTPDKRLRNAQTVLQAMTTEKGAPHDLFARARCVIIVPGLKKGAFVVGGDYGRGFAICRSGDSWGGPAAIRLGGGSFGAQLGLESTDVVMLVMNQRGMDRLAGDKFTIGGDASAAIGPIGRTVRAGTDATFRAELLTYARSKGAFAGVSLDGTTVTPDRSEDRKLYGEDLKNGQIIRGQVPAPDSASSLIALLNSVSGQPASAATQVAQNEPAPARQPQSVQAAPSPATQPQSNPAPASLPATASPYPAMGLMGALLLGCSLAVRSKRASE